MRSLILKLVFDSLIGPRAGRAREFNESNTSRNLEGRSSCYLHRAEWNVKMSIPFELIFEILSFYSKRECAINILLLSN